MTLGSSLSSYSPLILQTAEDAKDFFKRKIDFLTKQMEKIQPALQEKHAMKQGKLGLGHRLTLPTSMIGNMDCSVNHAPLLD